MHAVLALPYDGSRLLHGEPWHQQNRTSTSRGWTYHSLDLRRLAGLPLNSGLAFKKSNSEVKRVHFLHATLQILSVLTKHEYSRNVRDMCERSEESDSWDIGLSHMASLKRPLLYTFNPREIARSQTLSPNLIEAAKAPKAEHVGALPPVLGRARNILIQ